MSPIEYTIFNPVDGSVITDNVIPPGKSIVVRGSPLNPDIDPNAITETYLSLKEGAAHVDEATEDQTAMEIGTQVEYYNKRRSCVIQRITVI